MIRIERIGRQGSHGSRTLGLLAAGAIGVASVGIGFGIAGASTTAVSTATKDVIRRNLTPTQLGPNGGARATVVSVTLPPGQWVLASKESLVNFGPTDYVRCAIVEGSTDISGATSLVGDSTQPGGQGSGALVATIANIASVSSKTPVVVSVQCSHDNSNGSTPYVDADGALWAHRSPAIDNQGA